VTRRVIPEAPRGAIRDLATLIPKKDLGSPLRGVRDDSSGRTMRANDAVNGAVLILFAAIMVALTANFPAFPGQNTARRCSRACSAAASSSAARCSSGAASRPGAPASAG